MGVVWCGEVGCGGSISMILHQYQTVASPQNDNFRCSVYMSLSPELDLIFKQPTEPSSKHISVAAMSATFKLVHCFSSL